MSRTERASLRDQRGFTMIEVMVAIVVTAIAVFGVTGAVLASMHAQSNSDLQASLDDDALAVLSDVRMMTVYDPAMLAKLQVGNGSMTRTLPSGQIETITVTIAGVNGVAGVAASSEYATAVATVGALSASERITLFQHAPAPGSVVNQQ